MRIVERKFSGQITGQMIWVPTFVSIGSNILGRKFEKGSAQFTHGELANYLDRHSATEFQKWLDTLSTCYSEL